MKLSEIKDIGSKEPNKIFVYAHDEDKGENVWKLYWNKETDSNDLPFKAAILSARQKGIPDKWIRTE